MRVSRGVRSWSSAAATAWASAPQNGKAWGITAELTDRDQVPEVRKQLAAEHSDETLLVNAAGFFVPKAFSEYDEAFYDSYNELHRAVLHNADRRRGHGRRGPGRRHRQHRLDVGAPGHRGDAALRLLRAKGGLHSFTKALAIELAPHSIRVNAVAPAVVKTPPNLRTVPADKLDETVGRFDSFHPLGRVGSPEDIANETCTS